LFKKEVVMSSRRELRIMENELKEATLTIQDLVRMQEDSATKHSSVFVINTSDRGGLMQKGDVILPIRIGERAEPTLVKVPNTWIPIDLTSFVGLVHLADSIELRKALNSGVLTLIHENTALKILSSVQAREEQQLIIMRNTHIDDEAIKNLEKATGPQSEIVRKIVEERKKALASGNVSPEDGVNPRLVSIVNRDDLDSRAMIASLRTLENSLTSKDVHYVLSHVNSNKHEAVLAWARELLEEINEK